MAKRYGTTCVRAKTATALSEDIDNFWNENPGISYRNISIVMEVDQSRLNPQQGTPIFSAIVTYRIMYDLDRAD